MDELYLHSVASCNFGDDNNPERVLRMGTNPGWGSSDIDADDVDWNTPAHVVELVDDSGKCIAGTIKFVVTQYYVSANGSTEFLANDVSTIPASTTWAQPAGLFDEQPQLVELLATIAALALPLGALGAVVFFGNTISVATGTSGVSSQIIAVITIVVVILVIVEVFGQFIVYLDQAFDVIDKDRFAVYDNGLGTLAETITSFWGILAFASVLPIGFSLFRQYQSGGGIAGFGGGGGGRGV